MANLSENNRKPCKQRVKTFTLKVKRRGEPMEETFVVLKEYPHYLLLADKHYNFCVSKFDIINEIPVDLYGGIK